MSPLNLKNCSIADANHPEQKEGKHILIEKNNGADSIDLRHVNVFFTQMSKY